MSLPKSKVAKSTVVEIAYAFIEQETLFCSKKYEKEFTR